MRFEGKTALVTGSGRNIGRAIALAFAKEGANVVLNARTSRDEIESVAREVRQLGRKALPVLADVSDWTQVQGMVQESLTRFGSVDIMVHCAVLMRPKPFLDHEMKDWRETIGTILEGAYFTSKAVLPCMVQKGWGRLIFLGGRASVPGGIMPGWSYIIAAKHGMEGLMRGLAVEFAPKGITSNCISPGPVNTTPTHEHIRHFSQAEHQEWLNKRRSQIPNSRLAEPDEIAALCTFLTSDQGCHITGQVLHMNGGAFISF